MRISPRSPSFLFGLVSIVAFVACGDDGAQGDGTGSETTSDGDGEPGDDDGEPTNCGNGVLDDDEPCDDGNDVNEDGCTNACAYPACGDGYIQPSNGEECDDGNAVDGDGCSATCRLPGSALLQGILDTVDGANEVAYRVVIQSGDRLAVLADRGAEPLIGLDTELNLDWFAEAPLQYRPNLALGPGDELALVGTDETLRFDSSGAPLWTRGAPLDTFLHSAAFADDGQIYASGTMLTAGGSDSVILRYSPTGDLDWTLSDSGASIYEQVASRGARVCAFQAESGEVHCYAADQSPIWTSGAIPAGPFADMILDSEGAAYVLTRTDDDSAFAVTKLAAADGSQVWSEVFDRPDAPDTAAGLALLPTGGLLVAGSTNIAGGGDGLLVWLDADGAVTADRVIDAGDGGNADFLYGVAIDPEGEYGVAVGSSNIAGELAMWIYKFTL